MKYNILTVMALLSGVSFYALADSTISIHISEDNTVITESDSNNEPTYVTKGSLQKFDLKDQSDVNELAKSVEFEVFVINENSQIHTVFEHGGGICYGYLNNGVEVTDSATYYVKDKSKEEYYANISGGVVNHEGVPKKVQYASVFNINDPRMSKYLKEQDTLRGQNIAKKNLQDRTSVLSNVVCPPKKDNKKGK
ncbi:hypothetical protein [Lonepinella sp. BR2474]|uniref:hypothetical protein n=1 Tax=Lonepinella sp. BR2474 TaxID=3434548 RepID=UPI003F6DAB7E